MTKNNRIACTQAVSYRLFRIAFLYILYINVLVALFGPPSVNSLICVKALNELGILRKITKKIWGDANGMRILNVFLRTPAPSRVALSSNSSGTFLNPTKRKI